MNSHSEQGNADKLFGNLHLFQRGLEKLHPRSAKKAAGLLALFFLGGTAIQAAPICHGSLVCHSGNTFHITNLTACHESKGVLVSGSVHRNLGLGSPGGVSLVVQVMAPNGAIISSETVRVSFPNRRPIRYSRDGTFAIFVHPKPGSTICVGGARGSKS